MKKWLSYLMAISLAFFPAAVQADTYNLAYDDGDFEASTALNLPAGIPPLTAPVVEFTAPGTGVYALDSVSFLLRQGPEPDQGAPPMVLAAETTVEYPVTVRIWNKEGDAWVPGDSIDTEFSVGEKGWYDLLLTDDPTDPKVIFSGAIRIGIFFREVLPAPTTPPPPLNLGVDTDGTDVVPNMPFGHSFTFDAAIVPPADPWASPVPPANYGISASVHDVPVLTCQGFLPPFDHPLTLKKGGRTIPLKAQLFDETGAPVTRRMLASPPLVQLFFAEAEGVDPVDVTDKVVPAGRCNKGQAFRGSRGGRWTYNLKTKKSYTPGIYTVLMGSGDVTEYVIADPTCNGTFEILAPQPKKPHPPKGPNGPDGPMDADGAKGSKGHK